MGRAQSVHCQLFGVPIDWSANLSAEPVKRGHSTAPRPAAPLRAGTMPASLGSWLAEPPPVLRDSRAHARACTRDLVHCHDEGRGRVPVTCCGVGEAGKGGRIPAPRADCAHLGFIVFVCVRHQNFFPHFEGASVPLLGLAGLAPVGHAAWTAAPRYRWPVALRMLRSQFRTACCWSSRPEAGMDSGLMHADLIGL